MPTYTAPVEDVLFLLNDVFHIERHNNLPGFADASPDVVEAILVEAGKFCSEVLTPLNRQGDIQGCTRHPDGRVTTPDGFKAAYDQLVAGGWVGLSSPAEYGGQGLPSTLRWSSTNSCPLPISHSRCTRRWCRARSQRS